MKVRQLTADDLAIYRALHRVGLSEAPGAFVETLANDAARPDSVVAAMLARGEGWGLFDGERLVGKLVIDAPPYDCLAHTRWLHAVYLHPDARGAGAGAALMQAAITDARNRGATVSRFGSMSRTMRRGAPMSAWALSRQGVCRAASCLAGNSSMTCS